MYQALTNYIKNVEEGTSHIPEERKMKLQTIAHYVREKQEAGEIVNMMFICTHNSRRSMLCQIWAAAAAHNYGIEQIHTFSGGTETTAFNPRAVAAVDRAGFRIENTDSDNPRYRIFFADGVEPIECFSKTYDDSSNPQKNFAAVMTCSEADQNCPFIPGTSLRVSLPYNDPKEADGTPEETQIYDERCRQIATEMAYMMSQV